jgi:hypothetical protein
MKPESIGRALGIGLRVAGRIAGQRMAAGADAAANAPSGAAAAETDGPSAGQADGATRAAGKRAGVATKGVARGLGGFLRPFGRVGGIIWLEVTGVFFFLFAVVFARALWMYRASYAQGPDHRKFLASVPLLLIFLYFSISAFWRAQRK